MTKKELKTYKYAICELVEEKFKIIGLTNSESLYEHIRIGKEYDTNTNR